MVYKVDEAMHVDSRVLGDLSSASWTTSPVGSRRRKRQPTVMASSSRSSKVGAIGRAPRHCWVTRRADGTVG